MKEELVSIIVPVYKVEKYIEECIKSIINQTYRNIEIILVDDGSPDNCPKICDKYEKEDNRIKVIHKKNGGLSDARNVGIENATGKYIAFIDSDDYIHQDFVKELVKIIFEEEADISMCAVQKVDQNGKYFASLPISNQKELKGKEVILDIKKYAISNVIACNKLYKLNLFEDIRYPKEKINEDEFTTYKLLYKANKVAINQKELYYYRYHCNSITNSKFNNKKLDVLEALEERMQFFKNKQENELYIETINIYLSVIIYLYKIGKSYMNIEIRNYILKKYKECYNYAAKNQYITDKKILKKLFFIMPNVYLLLQKITDKINIIKKEKKIE